MEGTKPVRTTKLWEAEEGVWVAFLLPSPIGGLLFRSCFVEMEQHHLHSSPDAAEAPPPLPGVDRDAIGRRGPGREAMVCVQAPFCLRNCARIASSARELHFVQSPPSSRRVPLLSFFYGRPVFSLSHSCPTPSLCGTYRVASCAVPLLGWCTLHSADLGSLRGGSGAYLRRDHEASKGEGKAVHVQVPLIL